MSSTSPASRQVQRISYGEHPDQWGELHLPVPGQPVRGTVVVIHGGYWRNQWTADLGRPAAEDLAAHGFAAWNLEYRRAPGPDGRGDGGWPATFEDIAAGIDHVAQLAGHGVDPARVALLGHSAGGHLAVWAAGRQGLPADAPGAGPAVVPVGVVSQAGVLDLAAAHRLRLSDDAAANLMHGTADERPHEYALADPLRALPTGVPVLAVHSPADEAVPMALSRDYVEAARAAGDPAELHAVDGDHFAIITPGMDAYERCRALLDGLFAQAAES
ncbi:alpha/beta hydrolase [Sinomonas halotolerans]|uniref:Alpha/beta hydrolase n=1 Tax=Sinomonas halotolerans TaxID=1644133 RepID=A0ABU9X1Q9_9MICC